VTNSEIAAGPRQHSSEFHGTHDHILLSHESGSRETRPVMREWLTVKFLLVLASTVILGSEFHETHDHILLSHESGSRETPPVMREWLTVKLLLVLASTVLLGSEFHGTHDHILLSDCYGAFRPA
jgi:hypothetical protein